MSELSIKSMIEVAIQKEIEVPDEATGLVLYESSGSLVGEDEFGAKAVKVSAPSDKQLELINSKALEPQVKENWMIIKNINPLGRGSEVDMHHDTFEPAAERDMAKQGFWTPVLINHFHDMNPPIGRAIELTAGKEGLRETWAIPIASYNAEYREAILQGNMPEISIGAFIKAADKICNSCGDKSIYDSNCTHYPGRKDEKGNITTVSIKRVQRYAERSLVNIPARSGTSVKSMELDGAFQKSAEETEEAIKDVQGIPGEKTLSTSMENILAEGLAPSLQVSIDKDALTDAFRKALEDAFDGSAPESVQKSSPDTIAPVINATIEDNIVAEKQDVVEKAEDQGAEAVVETPAEVTDKAADVPADEPAAFDFEAFGAKLVESVKAEIKPVDVEPITKALQEQSEQVTKLLEATNKQAEDLAAVTALASELAETVKKLAEFSSEEAITKMLDVAAQLQEQTKKVEPPKPVELKSLLDNFVQEK